MSWARIDDGFDDHPKVLELLEHDQGAAAIGLWTLCLAWAHRNTRRKGKTPGLVPASLPRRYLGPGARELALLLVKVGLWEERGEGDGWLIHDFARYLPAEKTSEARSEAGRRGARARWGQRDADGSAPSTDGKLPSGIDNEPGSCHDTDGKPMASDGSRAPARRAIPYGIAPVPEPGKTSTAAQAPPKRGTRLPDDFTVTAEMVAWARQYCPNVDGRRETEKFTDYWQAKAGRDATKLDWAKTWKNWMRTAEERAPRNARASPLPAESTGAQRAQQAVEAGRRVQAMLDGGTSP